MEKSAFTPVRKLDHLRICLEENVESGWTGFGDVRLVHQALPDADMDSLSLQTRFFGHTLGSPLFISAMTGGHPETRAVNKNLALAAEKYQIGIGVGSQRAAIEDPSLRDTFSVVRETAPDAFVVANLGIVQIRNFGLSWAEEAISMIDADALAVHLNFLQEAIQPEGDHDASGCLQALDEICRSCTVPVIVKETGCGFSYHTAKQCYAAGAAAVDTGGWGGSSWAMIESYRARDSSEISEQQLEELGQLFADWGIPTAVSVFEVSKLRGPLIASGGLRTGIDIAKALALGADIGGMALPLLKPACTGPDALFETIDSIHRQIQVAMFLSGCKRVSDLAQARCYITGRTRDMIPMIHNTEDYNGD